MATIAALSLGAAILQAQDQLEIVSPGNGQLVSAGSQLTVTINASAARLQKVSLTGDGPFSHSAVFSAPPYRFSYLIPANQPAGRYGMKAEGITESGAPVRSQTIEVDIECADKPKKLQSEWQTLSVAERDTAKLLIWGVFADGSRVDLTRSSQMTYSSDRADVAAISGDGVISGSVAGKARITAKYADKSLVVPVVVTVNH
jgi:hypothetical protein